MEFLLFSTMPISIEMVSLIWTSIAVCLMVAFTVGTFEDMRIRLAFLCSESWRRQLIIFFITSCLFPIVFGIIEFIISTSGHMRLTTKGWMTPFLTVPILRNSQIHICSMDCNNNSSNIETSVDNQLGICIIL